MQDGTKRYSTVLKEVHGSQCLAEREYKYEQRCTFPGEDKVIITQDGAPREVVRRRLRIVKRDRGTRNNTRVPRLQSIAGRRHHGEEPSHGMQEKDRGGIRKGQ